MKNLIQTTAIVLTLSASAWIVSAQDGEQRPERRPGANSEMRGQRPPPSPLIQALDANRDGVIDETEIANASAALRKLDRNGDGKLTMDEIRPPRPEGAGERSDRPGPGREPRGSGAGPRGPQGQ